MLTLKIGSGQHWDSEHEIFTYTEPVEVRLEHSLRAISKWESKYRKPFLGRDALSAGELLDYVRCMCLDDGVPPAAFYALTKEQLEAVMKYVDLPMTATKFSNRRKSGGAGSFVTSELVYFWMCSYNIDWQAQDWHFNRLMTLIQVCAEKSQPPKKMGKGAAAARQRALNAKRLKGRHTGG